MPACRLELVLELFLPHGLHPDTEWPPAPARLLRALGESAALKVHAPGLPDWLQTQPAPHILAPDEGDPAQARSVHYLWRIAAEDAPPLDPDRLPAEPLALNAAAMLRLSLRSPASGCDRAGGVDPAQALPAGWRCWTPLRPSLPCLDEDRLLSVRTQAQGTPVLMAYRPTDARPRVALLACALQREDGAPAGWRPGEPVRLAGMVRHALIACAGEDAALAAFAAGHVEHDPDCRVAVVPVPEVGAGRRDGQLRHLLLTVRPEWAQALATLLMAAPSSGLPLVDEHSGERLAWAVPLRDPREVPVLRGWLRPSRCWASVQPVILPGMDSGQARRTRKLILRALMHAGLDPESVERLDFGQRGFVPESIDYRALFMKDRESWRRMPAVHVRLVFRRPTLGPIVLGQGRNAGVGTLVPCANPE
ncbi:MAG: type I-U CRISPR-associated protein Csb2 [Sphaerotilus natans subsp. sulfidivorans]|uniref:type I-G CRISPR-associated protein Csb2 n=1 Tax=Sphaerotilus sulfidivorans TaxID=639200 RepID=UPI0023522AD9|nr:type I-U CRISPR-associated protein Csb2 [Sphaerotilus sulfidivorans]MCK6401072.1 type I-U CRISPR-associated protein Csb2 [Sphaerotilus sulfidivorans]